MDHHRRRTYTEGFAKLAISLLVEVHDGDGGGGGGRRRHVEGK